VSFWTELQFGNGPKTYNKHTLNLKSMIKTISDLKCISEIKHLPQAQVLKILHDNFVLWWKASAKQLIPINKQQNNTDPLIRGISNRRSCHGNRSRRRNRPRRRRWRLHQWWGRQVWTRGAVAIRRGSGRGGRAPIPTMRPCRLPNPRIWRENAANPGTIIFMVCFPM
jgi:hypothetical protein